MKRKIVFNWPILSGSISTAKSRCGKEGCACKQKPPSLHGTYYRWTGFIDGKRTTKTLSKEMAHECKKQIASFRKLQQNIEELLKKALEGAPWTLKLQNPKKRRKKQRNDDLTKSKLVGN